MELQGAALLVAVAIIILCHLLYKLKQRFEATELSWGAIAKSGLLFEVHEDNLIDPFYLPLAPWGGISALRQGLLKSVVLGGHRGSRIPSSPAPAAAAEPGAAPLLLADAAATEGDTSLVALLASPAPLALPPTPNPTPSSRIPNAPRTPTQPSLSAPGTPIPAPTPLANMSAGRRRQQHSASTPGFRAPHDGSQLTLPPVCPNSPSRPPTALGPRAGRSSSSSGTAGRPPRSPAAAPVKPTPLTPRKAAQPQQPTTPLQQPWSPRTAVAPLTVSQQPWSPRKAPLSPTTPQQLLSPRRAAVPRSSPRVMTPQLPSPRKAAPPSPQQSPQSPAPQVLSPRRAPLQIPLPLPLPLPPHRAVVSLAHALVQLQVQAAIAATGKPLQQPGGQPSQHAAERQLPRPREQQQQLVQEEEEQEVEKLDVQQVPKATEEQQQQEGEQRQQQQSHEQSEQQEQQAPRVQQEDVPRPSQQQQQQQQQRTVVEQQQQQQPRGEGEAREKQLQEVHARQSIAAPDADPDVGGGVSTAAAEAQEVRVPPRNAASEGPEVRMTPRGADNDTSPGSDDATPAARTPAPFSGAARPLRSGTAGGGSSPTSVLMRAALFEGGCLAARGGGASPGGELPPATPFLLPRRSASSGSALCSTASFSSLASSDASAATPLSTASSRLLSCELSCGGGRASSSSVLTCSDEGSGTTCTGDDLGGAGSTIDTACYSGSGIASSNGFGGSCSSGGGSRYGIVSLLRTSNRWFSSVGGGNGGAGGPIGSAGAAGISFLALARVTQMDAAAAASSPPRSPFKHGGVAAVAVPNPAAPAPVGRRLGKPNVPRISGL